MPHLIPSSALCGIDAVPVFVQIDSNPGLHSFTVVGLGDKAVQESIERIDAAIRHCGFSSPRSKNRRFIVNLAPADLKKEGPGYDLPMAIAFLVETKQIVLSSPPPLMLGELGLNGVLAHTNGVLAATLAAKELGYPGIIVPSCNYNEASMVSGIPIHPVSTLQEAAQLLDPKSMERDMVPRDGATVPQSAMTPGDMVPRSGDTTVAPRDTIVAPSRGTPVLDDSYAYIHGQQSAKRALVIAAAGGHNVLMTGAPGSGKTLLARSLIGLLPQLSNDEAIEVAKIRSAAGILRGSAVTVSRPFCAPHHTSSSVSLIGGGTLIRPGQVSLSHRGVLFLDEMPEFARNVLEALRQPLEDGIVTVSRASGTLSLPAKFMLIGAMNPCPCGNAGDPSSDCQCSLPSITKYRKKISGPLLDRMDLHIQVARERVTTTADADTEGFQKARALIESARSIQAKRFAGTSMVTNSEITHKTIARYCIMDGAAQQLLTDIVNKRNLSLRAYHRIQKVARTIADVESSEKITSAHIAEAVAFRMTELA